MTSLLLLLAMSAAAEPAAGPALAAAPPVRAAGPGAPAAATSVGAAASPPVPAAASPVGAVDRLAPAPESGVSLGPADVKDSEPATEELEEMRALEEAVIDPTATSLPLRQALQQLGTGSPLQDQLCAAMRQLDDGCDELPFVLAPVGDISTFDVSLVRDRYDIPVEVQPLVEQYVRFFQGGGRKWFRRWMSRAERYIPLMQPLLEADGMPRDLVYLAMIESGFNTQAKSWAAAVGPWQFISATGQRFGLRQDFWVDERRDPIKSTHAASAYLKELYGQFGHWYLAWAGYNSGGGTVKRLIAAKGTTDFWAMSEGKGFRKETKHYVPKLIACALVARHPEAFGFSASEFEPEGPFEYEPVTLKEQVDLEILARAADCTVEDLKELNPEVKRWCTPPATEDKPYVLRIPKGRGLSFAENFAKLPPRERLNFAIHRVTKGETLSGISTRYHSAPEAIMRMNGLKSVRALRVNSDLIVPVPSAKALAAGRPDAFIERQAAQARRSGVVARPEDEVPAGTSSSKATASGTVKRETIGGKTRVLYGVATGDTLWSIGQRFDVTISELREWNAELPPQGKSLKVGTPLTIWPGAKAALEAK